MKKSARTMSLILGAAMLAQLQGCYGSFSLTRKMYAWNSAQGDKWINSVFTFVMMAVGVYLVAGIADWAVLNTIEFWTGKNPVTLKPGEKDVQMVQWKGEAYLLTATTNRLDVQKMADGRLQPPVSLVYEAGTQSWTAASATEQRRIIEMIGEDGGVADLIHPDGRKQRIELAAE